MLALYPPDSLKSLSAAKYLDPAAQFTVTTNVVECWSAPAEALTVTVAVTGGGGEE